MRFSIFLHNLFVSNLGGWSLHKWNGGGYLRKWPGSGLVSSTLWICSQFGFWLVKHCNILKVLTLTSYICNTHPMQGVYSLQTKWGRRATWPCSIHSSVNMVKGWEACCISLPSWERYFGRPPYWLPWVRDYSSFRSEISRKYCYK